MCLIIRKPAGVSIPHDLLVAALTLNGDGWGFMGHDARGQLLVERHAQSSPEALIAAELRLRSADIALHLRRRTRGRIDAHNTHPFEVDRGLYLMHNGTLELEGQAGHSDSRVLAEQLLRPLAQRHWGLLADPAFIRLLEAGLSPENKIVLYDHPRRQFDVLNQTHGVEFEGLWLSSIKWVDRTQLQLTPTAEGQQRSYAAASMEFL